MSDILDRLRKVAHLKSVHGHYQDANLLELAAVEIESLRALLAGASMQPGAIWPLGAKVRKKRGSSWRGTVCGYYSTPHTPVGYCVDSAFEPGSVQVWPEVALEDWDGE